MISVIVPVYNAENTVENCIGSILRQTYEDFELILIDDGSKDASGEICDRYQSTDRRVKCLHIENGGVSNARNTGLEHSVGEYIAFVDADDTIEPQYLATLLHMLSFADADLSVMAECHNEKFRKRIPAETKGGDVFLDRRSALMSVFTSAHFAGHPWGKMFRRDLIGELRFDTGLHYCEDLLFAVLYLLRCRKVCYTETNLYNYVVYGESASQGRMNASKLSACRVIQKIKEALPPEYRDLELYVDYDAVQLIMSMVSMVAKSPEDTWDGYLAPLTDLFQSIPFWRVYRLTDARTRSKMLLLKNHPKILLKILRQKYR